VKLFSFNSSFGFISKAYNLATESSLRYYLNYKLRREVFSSCCSITLRCSKQGNEQ